MRVLLFTKFPAPGLVKTRLAADVGPVAAAELQAAFVRDELDMLQGLRMAVTMCCDPHRPLADYGSLFGPWPQYALQQGSDLGQRMDNALAAALRGGAGRVALIGSDLPDLPADRILGAFNALETSSLCLGPAPDGGFFLLGASRPLPPGLFAGVVWGGRDVLDRTLGNCRSLSPALLDSWPDVDTASDLRDYAARNRNRATRSMHCIRALNLAPEAWND